MQLVYVANALRKHKHFNPGVTQEEFSHLAQVSRGSYQTGWRGEMLSEQIATRMLRLVAEKTPPAWRHWPTAIQGLWAEYSDCEAEFINPDDPKNSPKFLRYIQNRKHFLEGLRGLRREDIHGAAYQWLLAWVHHDLAVRFEIDPAQNIRRALRCYQRAIDILSALINAGETQYAFLLQKAALAQWVTLFASKPEEGRDDNPALISWVATRGLIEVAYGCAKEEPYAWSAIRNGLVMASISKLKGDCDAFFALLIESDPNFAYLDYVPAPGVYGLQDNTDLKFFLSNLPKQLVKERKSA